MTNDIWVFCGIYFEEGSTKRYIEGLYLLKNYRFFGFDYKMFVHVLQKVIVAYHLKKKKKMADQQLFINILKIQEKMCF
jgi:hypothetical protein